MTTNRELLGQLAALDSDILAGMLLAAAQKMFMETGGTPKDMDAKAGPEVARYVACVTKMAAKMSN